MATLNPISGKAEIVFVNPSDSSLYTEKIGNLNIGGLSDLATSSDSIRDDLNSGMNLIASTLVDASVAEKKITYELGVSN